MPNLKSIHIILGKMINEVILTFIEKLMKMLQLNYITEFY